MLPRGRYGTRSVRPFQDPCHVNACPCIMHHYEKSRWRHARHVDDVQRVKHPSPTPYLKNVAANTYWYTAYARKVRHCVARISRKPPRGPRQIRQPPAYKLLRKQKPVHSRQWRPNSPLCSNGPGVPGRHYGSPGAAAF